MCNLSLESLFVFVHFALSHSLLMPVINPDADDGDDDDKVDVVAHDGLAADGGDDDESNYN